MKLIVLILKKTEMLSAVAMYLTMLTGKSKVPLHPKHLIKSEIWFRKYLQKNNIVLDLGCNSGQITLKVAPLVKKIIGLDINRLLINIANGLAKTHKVQNVKFIISDANNKLPFKNSQFDRIICSDVLEHLNKRDFALSEIKRVLKPKGLLFLVTDNPDTSWKRLQKSAGLFYYADPDHKYEYPRKEIIAKLKSQNFKVISVGTVTYDTPLKGLIDLAGGISLNLYKILRKWKESMIGKHPEDTTGYKIVTQKV